MLVTDSQVALSSEHRAQQSRTQSETLQLFRVRADGQTQRLTLAADSRVSLSEQALSLSRQVEQQDSALADRFARQDALAAVRETTQGAAHVSAGAPTAEVMSEGNLDGNMLMLKAIIEKISGKKLEVFDSSSLHSRAAPVNNAPGTNTTGAAASASPRASVTGPDRFGMAYQRSDVYVEEEQTRFRAVARIETADGRHLDLNLDLQMSRRFASQSRLEIEAGVQLKDPLVINFGAQPVSLSDSLFNFDIDADGDSESIAFVNSASGLLALDRNGDGRINDGRELFGALSGNGFDDLAAYDDDGNGFIDSGDAVFADLKIWIKEDGEDRLLALADKGIGALYLGYSDTPFELKDEQNRLQGQIRSTGVYLTEAGGAGTLQQIDLKV